MVKKKRKKKSIVNWRKIREFRVDNGILFCYFFKKKKIFILEKNCLLYSLNFFV
jgi:hypothetical protein